MNKKAFILSVLILTVLIPCPLFAQESDGFRQDGIASWYGKEFEGRPTASGEIFDASQLTAAHPSLPFGTMVTVTNQQNNRKVTVRVNDRGPFVSARIIDVSKAAAEQLDMISTGTAPVLVERVGIASAPAKPPVQEPAIVPVTTMVVSAPEPVYVPQPAAVQAPVVQTPVVQTPVVQAPVVQVAAQIYTPQIKLSPDINIMQNKSYRLQLGSYKVARNAVETFEKLKNAGLNPAYERHEVPERGEEYFRVVLAGIPGSDVEATTVKLQNAGFREALIRLEN
jgi:rare lipoprotein A